jgi:hypothetical protein
MNQASNAAAPQREIPTPPGGGSWTFDEQLWDWVSNDPAPADQTAAAEPAAAPIAAPVAEQPANQE